MSNTQPEPKPVVILDVSDLARRYDVSRMSIYRWIKNRDLPPCLRMPGKSACWFESMIEQWEEAKGVCKMSALYAQSEGISPCSRIDTIHRLAKVPFPKVVQQDELEFEADKRPDDAVWTPTPDIPEEDIA